MSIVYDQAPTVTYDPSARITSAGPIGEPPHVDWAQPHRQPSSAAPAPAGFGGVTTRRMLDMGAPPKHPWLTVDLARQEMAMQAYAEDRVQVFLDTARA